MRLQSRKKKSVDDYNILNPWDEMMTGQMEFQWNRERSDTLSQPIDAINVASDGSVFQDWLGGIHPEGKLEFNKRYVLHKQELNRLLNYLIVEDPSSKVQVSTANALGITRINSKALFNHCTSMELVYPRSLKPAPLAELYNRYDPFFTDTGGIWLLHYLIASDPRNVIWNYLFNVILQRKPEIALGEARDEFKIFAGRWSEYSIDKKVRQELGALKRTYQEGIFSNVEILESSSDDQLIVARNSKPIPSLVFLVAAFVYRDRFFPGATSIDINHLINGLYSPGRILHKNERIIRKSLDELHEARFFTLETKANLDQIRFTSDITWIEYFRMYLEDIRVNYGIAGF